MKYYERLIACLTSVGGKAVSHVEHMKKDRYIVWEEDGGNDFCADGKHAEKSTFGIVDLFTKIEFDPWKEAIEEGFDAYGIAWESDDMDYEEDTGFYHHQWRWNIVNG